MSTPVCEAMSEQLVAYVDGEQPAEERARIEAHLSTCLTCRREVEQITKVNAAVVALPRIEPSPEFAPAMWSRLRSDGAAQAPRAPARRQIGAAEGRRRQRRSLPVEWGLPALAAAAIFAFVWVTSRAPEIGLDGPASGPKQVAEAPAEPSKVEKAPEMRASAEGDVGETAAARDATDSAVAAASPEDLPPELLENPELFLRYPVVRRLRKLQSYEQVRPRIEPGDEGAPPASEGPVG